MTCRSFLRRALSHSMIRLSGNEYKLHTVLVRPPSIAKMLLSAEKEIPRNRRVFLLGSQVRQG
jgi:hypothetical protein